MNKVAIYSVQLQTAAPAAGARYLRPCGTISQLMGHITGKRPALVLMELIPDVPPDGSKAIPPRAGASIILRGDALSPELASQALCLGIRGILRRDVPVECHLQQLWGQRIDSDRPLHWRQVTLTARERQLLDHVALDLKNKEIARSMGVTEGTVKVALSRLCDKVGASDRQELAALGRRFQLLRA